MICDTIGDMEKGKIVELRKSLGMTREEFAVELGVGIATIQRWESGKFSPSRMAEKQLQKLVVKNQGGGK